MKAGYDARIRAKAEKEQERLREAEEQMRDEEARRTDPESWLREVRKQHEVSFRSVFGREREADEWVQDVIAKIKARKKNKEQLSDRKSLAAQNRMKSIATLASDVKTGKKRKRGDKGAFSELCCGNRR